MKILKIVLGILITLTILFFVVGIFLPKTYSVVRTTEINAPDSVIYHNVADFNKFMVWNPWYKMDPKAKVTIAGPNEQPGNVYSWDGEKTGQGKMTTTQVTPYSLVQWDLDFIKPFVSHCVTKVVIEPDVAGQKVTWSIEGENKTTMERWMGLTMDMMMGKDFESGLKDLKAVSEKK